MNKCSKQAVWMGLLAMLLIPGVVNAQVRELAKLRSPGTFERVVDGKKVATSRAAFRQQIADAVEKVNFQYVPRVDIISYPDVTSRRDLKELEQFTGGKALNEITPLQLAKNALWASLGHGSAQGQAAEKAVVLALNSGANPADILYEAIVRCGIFHHSPYYPDRLRYASDVLVEEYGLDPNGIMSNGDPIPLTLWKEGKLFNVPHLPKGMNFNVQFNGEPLIFATPTSKHGFGEFGRIFFKIDPWTTTNKMQANPLHIGANAFNLSDMFPEDFKIPEDYLQATDINGNGYLHYAAQGQYWKENVEWLIKHGVKPSTPNRFGITPEDIVTQRIRSFAEGK